MLHFSINRLVVLSPHARKAKTLNFDPKCTVLTGPNHTGKSALIKSLMYALGAEPKIEKAWKTEAAKLLVSFTVGGVGYKLLREGRTFTAFGSNDEPLHIFHSITDELGPWMAGLTNFGVKLTATADRALATPPPAFLFLPYYFDQDASWTNSWSGFEHLQQMSKWKQDLIEYHVGLRPNDYYTLKGDYLRTKQALESADAALQLLKSVREQVMDQYRQVTFSIDLEAFQHEIKELLVLCAGVQKEAEKIRDRLVGLYTEKIEVESQIEIVSRTLKELNSDYKFLRTVGNHVDCPTCGAQYDASFAERFRLAADEDRCEALLSGLREEQTVLVQGIDAAGREHRSKDLEVARIRALLEYKRDEVKLEDLIDSESKRRLKGVLDARFQEANDALLVQMQRATDLMRELKKYTDAERRKEIKGEFRTLFHQFVGELELHGIQTDKFDFHHKVHSQGSNLPRALLAYGFAILHVMLKRSSSAYCPIVIDSPIQQEQDQPHHVRILEFIRDRQPKGSQLILGVVDRKGVDFPGTTIEFSQPRAVLSGDEYDSAYHEISPYLQAALRFGGDLL